MPHIHDKIDYTVEVYIIYEGRILLRKHDKYNVWLSVGGHIELDEDPNQAAIREVKEEVGLDIKLINLNRGSYIPDHDEEYRELVIPFSINRHRITPTHEHVCLNYLATSLSDKVIPEKQTDQWKWCTASEIDDLDSIPENVKFYAKKALKLLK